MLMKSLLALCGNAGLRHVTPALTECEDEYEVDSSEMYIGLNRTEIPIFKQPILQRSVEANND